VSDLLDAEQLEELRDGIRLRIAAGYDDRDTIIEYGLDDLLDEVGDREHVDEAPYAALVRRVVEEEVQRHLVEQRRWPATTDYDRLSAAFTDLTRSGIMALQHFACCGTCARAEIPDEFEKYGPSARGYAYFHMQDTESALIHGEMYLSFGSVTDEPGPGAAIGAEIVAALQRHGLRTEWDGRFVSSILVKLDWKRRLPAGLTQG
jgi:hypothetical protein